MRLFQIIFLVFCLFTAIQSQTATFTENKKWGIKENEKIIIPAVYDTIFNFESSGRVCLGCQRVKNSSSSKFIRITTSSYTCNYLNQNNQRLIIRNRAGDTCSSFSLGRHTVQQYNGPSEIFAVGAK